jgi:hypothetical protein
MPQTIDVTGLTPEQVREIERTVEGYRARAASPPPAPAEEPPAPFWTGPVPSQDSPDWINWLRAWAESHPKREGPVEIDDDRGSIYDRDTP